MSAHEVVKSFEYRGHRCIVVFNAVGVHCGYVEIPPKHWLWGRTDSFDESLNSLCVHGGITYSDDVLPGDLPSSRECWYIGFDCNHYCDRPDMKRALRRGLLTQEEYERQRNIEKIIDCEQDVTFKDADFVEAQLKQLVDQFFDEVEEGGEA